MPEKKLKRLAASLDTKTRGKACARIESGSAVLEGTCSTWDEKVSLGWHAARYGFRGVVNDIAVEGIDERARSVFPVPRTRDSFLDGKTYDVVIIGGGVVGCAIARELSKKNLKILLAEKEYDLATHATGRNDGMIHDGFAAHPGSKKASYNVRGNRLWEPLAKNLGVEFSRPGSVIVFRSPGSKYLYPFMADRARRNGVDGWEYWSRKRLFAEEPNICDSQQGGFFLPSAGILSPYRATIALAENAAANGVDVSLETVVLSFCIEDGEITRVSTNRGDVRAGTVVNAAGVWSDEIARLAGDRFFSIHPRRGTDMILDLSTGPTQKHILGMPSLLQVKEKTKGGGLVKTIEGNILVGPTAVETPFREDYSTNSSEFVELYRHLSVNKTLSASQAITYFAGTRACTYEEDFIVEKSLKVKNLVHAAGIQSPGLASAPAIAEDIAAMISEILSANMSVAPNQRFDPERTASPELKKLPFGERAKAISANPSYGRIVCRCEEVSEGEIMDALGSRIGVPALDAVKRRTRAGMGRCHGGFCTPRVIEIVAGAQGVPLGGVTKKGGGSYLLYKETKADRTGEKK